MNELALKKVTWSCFHEQPWTDLEYLQDIILETYFEADEDKVPSFEDIRQDRFLEEEITMPIVSFYAFGDENKWQWYDPKETKHFVDVYEDTFSDIQNDMFAVLYENRLFFNHYDNEYIHIPLVQVW